MDLLDRMCWDGDYVRTGIELNSRSCYVLFPLSFLVFIFSPAILR